eukprot:jgi/Psemu1/2051/gm1.2051_g
MSITCLRPANESVIIVVGISKTAKTSPWTKPARLANVRPVYANPDEEKAAVGGASIFLSYAKGKIDSCVHEQYLANPFATKADHLQNAHDTAFLDIISDPVLGSARVKTTLQELIGSLQTTSKDGKTINKLRDEKRGPQQKHQWILHSKLDPITIDGEREGSKHRSPTLIHPSSRNQESPKDKTPAFVRSVCQLAFQKADFQMNSQDTHDILDFVGPKLTYKDDLEVAVNMKVHVLNHGESGNEVAESLSSVVKWCKRVQVHKKQKVQKEED